MRVKQWLLLAGAAVLCLGGALIGGAARRERQTAAAPASLIAPRRSGAFETALRQAWECRTRARLAANREREAMEAWDPGVTAERAEPVRREQMVRDADGSLRRAHAQALEAVGLARTPSDQYRASWLLARIECDRGNHQAELRQAQRLVELAPHQERSREALEHALACLGQ
jgi:hypothetical protein